MLLVLLRRRLLLLLLLLIRTLLRLYYFQSQLQLNNFATTTQRLRNYSSTTSAIHPFQLVFLFYFHYLGVYLYEVLNFLFS